MSLQMLLQAILQTKHFSDFTPFFLFVCFRFSDPFNLFSFEYLGDVLSKYFTKLVFC